jgi:hypothetical protein
MHVIGIIIYDDRSSALERNFDVIIERAAREARSATWNLGTNSAFCYRTEENHRKP